ncbi:hypothetical protein [Streptomyces europaeiscabiei]|uniref:hypothetical protein n=1 Tax=Streptomyces europaeiscabiei TaxID=146819 RepID=UPI002E13320D|nr:hypothetical protein OHB30_45090 [Streptomyces europaeiscabiei]
MAGGVMLGEFATSEVVDSSEDGLSGSAGLARSTEVQWVTAPPKAERCPFRTTRADAEGERAGRTTSGIGDWPVIRTPVT